MFYLLFILFLAGFTEAQVNPGARQIAICNSDIGFADDVFAVFSNPSGLAQIKWREIGVFYSPAPFGLKELANGFIAYNEHTEFGSISLGAMTYGYEFYRENKFLLSFSRGMTENFFLGAELTYQMVSIKNYGSTGLFYLSAGALAKINRYCSAGFSVININYASAGSEDDQIPMIINSGLSYNYSDLLLLHLAIQKDIRYNFSFAGGIEYFIRDIFAVRSGFSTEPLKYSAGTGIHFGNFTFDYAVNIHRELGLTHQFGLIFSLADFANRQKFIRGDNDE
jgi:hypothetical protein